MQMREKVADEMHRIQATNRTWTMEQLADAAIAAMWPLAMEAAAKACEAEERAFAEPEYARTQILGGFVERFACRECAAAIRNLAPPQGDEGDVG